MSVEVWRDGTDEVSGDGIEVSLDGIEVSLDGILGFGGDAVDDALASDSRSVHPLTACCPSGDRSAGLSGRPLSVTEPFLPPPFFSLASCERPLPRWVIGTAGVAEPSVELLRWVGGEWSPLKLPPPPPPREAMAGEAREFPRNEPGFGF